MKNKLASWFQEGFNKGYDFMIIVCDTYDYGDYPIFTSRNQFENKFSELRKERMSQIMEVYNLNMDMESQLNVKKTWNLPNV